MAPLPTLILLHGSWHSASTWDAFTPLLKSQGYTVIAPQVCFCGTPEPLTSIAPPIAQIRALIASETAAGRNVVLLNHSFGGVVGCSAARGFTTSNSELLESKEAEGGKRARLIGIIQIAALTIPTGTSLLSFLGPNKSGIAPIAVAGPDGWDVIVRDVRESLYNDMDAQDAEYWAGRLLKHSSATRASSEDVYAGWKDVPVCYVKCMKDLGAPVVAQEKMIESIRGEGMGERLRVRELEAGHCPMLSMPEKLARVVVEAVGEMVEWDV